MDDVASQAESPERAPSCDEARPRTVQRGWITLSIDPVIQRIEAPKFFPEKCCCCLAATRSSWKVLPIRGDCFKQMSIPTCPDCLHHWKRRIWKAAGATFGVLTVLGMWVGWLIEMEPLGYSAILLLVYIVTLGCTGLAARFFVAPAIVASQSFPSEINIRFHNREYAAMVWDWNTVG